MTGKGIHGDRDLTVVELKGRFSKGSMNFANAYSQYFAVSGQKRAC